MVPPGGVGQPGRDLEVPPGPGLPSGLVVPAAELVERFSRSSGPGGQSVNTTDSRVELEYDVAASPVLTDTQRARALRNLTSRLTDGRVVVDASEHRSQHRNRVAARERLADLLRTALAPPPPKRRPTKPSRASQRRRVETKKQRGRTKALRGRVRGDGG
jgi:ribosome-associated protein